MKLLALISALVLAMATVACSSDPEIVEKIVEVERICLTKPFLIL